MRGIELLRALTVGSGMALISAPALAAPAEERFEFDASESELGALLQVIARQAGTEIIFSAEAVSAIRSGPVRGTMTLREALDAALRGTLLSAQIREDGVVIRTGRTKAAPVSGDAPENDIVVTGSRIRGASVAAPVITISDSQIRDRGQSDLGEVIRALPQNFSGGQNPGITLSAGGGNQNVTASSSLNLRGLGADATLTLLNGHRMAYDGASQAIDISAIPVAALDRIEIVVDGSSALYGSDAVAGVANVILKRDFSGFDARSRFGAATEGGFVQRQYSAVSGDRWGSGGFMIAADYARSSSVTARERAITRDVPDETTLYPQMEAWSIVAAGHQDLSTGKMLQADAYYSRRTSRRKSVYSASGFSDYGVDISTRTEAIGAAPRLVADLGGSWRAEVAGAFARQSADLDNAYYISGAPGARYPVSYVNTMWSGDINLEGSLFPLPGGESRLAVGAGFRSSNFKGDRRTISASGNSITTGAYDSTRNSYFAYGELHLPIIDSPDQMGLRKFTASAAARYEHHPEFGSVLTPKVGIIYSPLDAVEIKGSWGKSFKAPTLYQTTVPATNVLDPASMYVSGQPASATVLYTDGGNPDAGPERATTWTASLALTPRLVEGSRFEISYFKVRYSDRILMPLGSAAGALTNPIYASIITQSPTRAQIDAVLARSPNPLINGAGVPFTYENVIALIDNRYQNFTTYSASGVDISAHLPFDLGASGKLTVDATATYQKSEQQANGAAPVVKRAGTINYPPHWRAHVGATWSVGDLTVSPSIDYIGGVNDTRAVPNVGIKGMTTFDLVMRQRLGGSNGPELGIIIQNAFNTMPDRVSVPVFYYPPYDSTNYPVLGRFVAVTFAKAW